MTDKRRIRTSNALLDSTGRCEVAPCQEVLNLAQARIDELTGLQDAKEQIAAWRNEI